MLQWTWIAHDKYRWVNYETAYQVDTSAVLPNHWRGSCWERWYGEFRATKEEAMQDCELHAITERLLGNGK